MMRAARTALASSPTLGWLGVRLGRRPRTARRQTAMIREARMVSTPQSVSSIGHPMAAAAAAPDAEWYDASPSPTQR